MTIKYTVYRLDGVSGAYTGCGGLPCQDPTVCKCISGCADAPAVDLDMSGAVPDALHENGGRLDAATAFAARLRRIG
jgi:hypothetical protein